MAAIDLFWETSAGKRSYMGTIEVEDSQFVQAVTISALPSERQGIIKFWDDWWDDNAYMIQHNAARVAIAFAEAWAKNLESDKNKPPGVEEMF